MQNQNSELNAFREQKLKDEIEGIAKALEVVANNDAARLSEYVFKNVFLPFFAGDENPMYPVNIAHWINVAGSPFAQVHVVDQKNNVLFTVPPLYDRSAIQPVSKDGGSIAHVVQSSNQLARVHPSQGENFLSAELTKRALIMKVPTNVLQHIEVWNEIFKRYGRPPIIALEESASPAAASSSSVKDGDDYEFVSL